MSGRQAFRKGHHPTLGRYGRLRRRRTPAHLRPRMMLAFTMPVDLGFSVAHGPHGYGVKVLDYDRVEVTAHSELACRKLALDFLGKLHPTVPMVFQATVYRPDGVIAKARPIVYEPRA